MKCYIGLGSNLEDRRSLIEAAARTLRDQSVKSHLRLSPIYTTPALVPEGAPLDWSTPYLNAVAEIEWDASALELMRELKKIELNLGRTIGARWAPRQIDLDLLLFGDQIVHEENLQVPHPEILRRSFVLDPLKDLVPQLILPTATQSVLTLSRKLPTHSPLVMGIVNLTPDSFSDGGELESKNAFALRVQAMDQAGVHIIDLGAESTRPGAHPVDPAEEWRRLHQPLKTLQTLFAHRCARPIISVDTRNAATAERALVEGADWINDVSSLDDPEMMSVLKKSSCSFVIMHHQGIPADSRATLPTNLDPVVELKQWLSQKLQIIERHGIDPARVIFDPGIGFGKSAHQSISILKRSREFLDLPVRVLIGHSRKSFMKIWGQPDILGRDFATLGASLGLAAQGVDILRVHTPEDHLLALHARLEML